MYVDPKFKLDKIVSQDPTRPNLNSPYLDVDKKRLVATNGYCLVMVPVEEVDQDTKGMIPLDALRAAGKGRMRSEIVANGDVKVLGVSYPRPQDKFPPIGHVLPRFKEGAEGTITTIGVDAQYIADLAKAMNAKQVKITINIDPENPRLAVETDPMLVEPIHPNGATGVLMPCRVK